MNKKNKILVGCLALLLVLSVGYALFSDTITINGTATAKGSFDITATCEPGIASKLGTTESLGLDPELGYESSSCEVNDDEVSLNVSFNQPIGRRQFTIKLTNNGTIAANATLFNQTEHKFCLSNNIDGTDPVCITDINIDTIDGYRADFARVKTIGEDAEGNILTDEQMAQALASGEGLKPKWSIYIILEGIVTNYGISQTNEFSINYDTTYKFEFEQVTN